MTYRLRNVVLAVALAALAALLTSFYLANYKETVRADEADVTVYVATREIPPGTPGTEVVAKRLLEPQEVARRTVVPGAISDPSQVERLVATETVYEGEQVSVRRFKPASSTGVRSELKGNLRAIQVDGTAHQLLAGTIKRGDRVDVVGTFVVRLKDDDRDHPVTRVVLRDLLVLKAPTRASLTDQELGGQAGAASVQLAVTDAQAQKLEFARKKGEWALALRAPVDATDSPESLETLDTMLCDGMKPGAYPNVCFGRNG